MDTKVEETTQNLNNLLISEEEEEIVYHPIPHNDTHEEDYYIHIDMDQSSRKFIRDLNKYMVAMNSFDPRMAMNSPKELLAPGVRDNISNRRFAINISRDRYEFWKVKKTFSLYKLSQFIEKINYCDTFVTLTVIEENDHELIKISTNQIK